MAWVVLTFNLLVSVWNHVVITWQLRCGAKLLLDGDLVDALTYPCDTTDPTIENPRFVKGADYQNRFSSTFEGALDELRVWDAVMTDDEVKKLFIVDAERN